MTSTHLPELQIQQTSEGDTASVTNIIINHIWDIQVTFTGCQTKFDKISFVYIFLFGQNVVCLKIELEITRFENMVFFVYKNIPYKIYNILSIIYLDPLSLLCLTQGLGCQGFLFNTRFRLPRVTQPTRVSPGWGSCYQWVLQYQNLPMSYHN